MIKVFIVTHTSEYSVSSNIVYAEGDIDVVDLAIHDSIYEPDRSDEFIVITPIDYLIEKHLDLDALENDLASRRYIEFTIVSLASPEERKEYLENLDSNKMDQIEFYCLRDD